MKESEKLTPDRPIRVIVSFDETVSDEKRKEFTALLKKEVEARGGKLEEVEHE